MKRNELREYQFFSGFVLHQKSDNCVSWFPEEHRRLINKPKWTEGVPQADLEKDHVEGFFRFKAKWNLFKYTILLF